MRDIRRVVVVGANGTMGSGAGALFAARGFEVAMLARTEDKAREGLARAKNAVRSDVIESHMSCGSYDEALDREVARADLVLEAVAEDLPTKNRYFDAIDGARRPGTVIATVSSGLSMAQMSAGRSDDFQRHFMGIHLFNPPHVIVGTELISGPNTDRELLQSIKSMLRKKLGRVVVECRDMPAFAGNRIGFKVLNECAQLAEKHGVAKVDYLIGPYTGRAMPPLATIDLVGFDVHKAIVDNVYANTRDEAHEAFAMPAYMSRLIALGHLGNKTSSGGFYRASKADKTVSTLRPASLDHATDTAFDKVGFIEEMKLLHHVGRYADAMELLLAAHGPEADLVRRVVFGYVSYALSRVGPTEVAADVTVVDQIMGWGFNWAPPSVLVDLCGRKQVVQAMNELGLKVPAVVQDLPDGQKLSGQHSNIGRYFVAK
ncbi:MAG: 3-hydroxyacyl-CoA dehydrogenase family protein [Deltaproteobacteria bacterium]|nr:3-hydroxyacyl-CoA dehydrogenase family protein [Deltaproteobacteria bacterium]